MEGRDEPKPFTSLLQGCKGPGKSRESSDKLSSTSTPSPTVIDLVQDLFSHHKTAAPPSAKRSLTGHRSKRAVSLTSSGRRPRDSLYDSPKLVLHHVPRYRLIYPPEQILESALDLSSSVPARPGLKMKSSIQFLTTPTADTPGTTLLLYFDNKRYLFGNLAEGTQRASIQFGARLLKVTEMFLTGRTEWSNIGGLLGMILTLADSSASSVRSTADAVAKKALAKAKKEGRLVDEDAVAEEVLQDIKDKTRLTLFGSGNLNYMLATARRFVFRKGLPVDAREVSQGGAGQDGHFAPLFADENLKVWAMAISPDQAAERRTAPNGTISPRKRSYDELTAEDSMIKDVEHTQLVDTQKTAIMSKAVVSEMFDSSWRMDALVEMPIQDVRLPAALFVRDPETNKLEKYSGPMPGIAKDVPNIKVWVRRPWPGALVASLPPTQPIKDSISYIIRNHPQRGKFNPKRAKELGVEMGNKWAELSKGISVTSQTGETVTPDMVLGEFKVGGGVAIIDLPSLDYVEPLVRRPEWKSEELMTGVGAIVWILGPGVASSPVLKQFMEDKKDLKHVVSSQDVCSNRFGMDSAAAATIRLAHVDPVRYTTPAHENQHPQHVLPDFIHVADRGHAIQLDPVIALQTEQALPLVDPKAVLSELPPAVMRLADEARQAIENDKSAHEAWASSLPDKDAEIVTLGTGSALPSKYRNVSATLLRVPGWGAILLDCGENTLGQLKRVFPPDEFQQVLKELRILWISHMHADHHLGTVSVIKAWYEAVHQSQPTTNPDPSDYQFTTAALFANQTRLAVVSDAPMLHWLWEYSHVEDYGYTRLAPLFITAARPTHGAPSKLGWFLPPTHRDAALLSAFELRDEKLSRLHVAPSLLGLADMQAVQVRHCAGARAVALTLPSGFKASYSGDCRPSNAFARIGRGSTVVVHEATFDDELQGDAEAKQHSTTGEALGVAADMRARAVVLTHFSQRYQKVPVLEFAEGDGEGEEGHDGEAVMDDAGLDVLDGDQDASMDTARDDLPSRDIQPPSTRDGPGSAVTETRVRLGAGTRDMKVCVAFDYMRVKIAEIPQLAHFTPALLRLFAADEADKGDKAEKGDKAAVAEKNGNGGKNEKKKKKKEEKHEGAGQGVARSSSKAGKRGKGDRHD